MTSPTVNTSVLSEIKSAQEMISKLKEYKSKNWGIGLNGSTFQPDSFLGYFKGRELPFQYYVRQGSVSIGQPSAYQANIDVLQKYIDHMQVSETRACESIINELKTYESNNWAVGLNGDTLQPDGFNPFFAVRNLTLKPYVRGKATVGESTDYKVNIKTMKKYMASVNERNTAYSV